MEDFDRLIENRKAEYVRKNRFREYMPGAGVDWLSSEERAKYHELRMQLPTFAEERTAAEDRIKARIAARKALKESAGVV